MQTYTRADRKACRFGAVSSSTARRRRACQEGYAWAALTCWFAGPASIEQAGMDRQYRSERRRLHFVRDERRARKLPCNQVHRNVSHVASVWEARRLLRASRAVVFTGRRPLAGSARAATLFSKLKCYGKRCERALERCGRPGARLGCCFACMSAPEALPLLPSCFNGCRQAFESECA